MYGTVARLRLRPGTEAELKEHLREFEEVHVPGYITTIIYRTDEDPQEYILSVVFESKETYVANAESPEQDARYREMARLLEKEPEWHDGEVVYSHVPEEKIRRQAA